MKFIRFMMDGIFENQKDLINKLLKNTKN
ncbi:MULTISPECIES: hypothetical protein [Borreliella]